MAHTIPKISVLMPAFNADAYISEAIESILKQTFKDFELIIADDCSTDSTWKIINTYAKNDKRIKVVKNKKNLYIAGNRNKLVQLAKGPYIAWQDADDIAFPKRLEHQYKFLEKHKKVGIVGGFLQFFNEKGIVSTRKYASTDANLRKNIFKFSPVAQPAAMLRKECFEKMGDYNLKYPPAEDLDMSFRIGTKYQFANLQENVIKYRDNANSATYKKLKKIELSTLEIRQKYSHGYGYHMNLGDKAYNLLQKSLIHIIPPKIKIQLFSFFRNTR